MKDTIYREDAIKAIHNYWKKRLDTLPTKESECGEVYADIQQMDKILEHNKTLCNFIKAIPSADRPQGEWKPFDLKWGREIYACTTCGESVEVPTCMGKPLFKFCPLCGARMKGADDEQAMEKGNSNTD